MFFPISEWFAAFALTIAVEVPLVVLLVRDQRIELARLLVVVVMANLATHLAFWYVFTQLLDVGTLEYVLVGEAWAVAAEAVFFWAAFATLGLRRAALVAVITNAASFAVGELVRSVSKGV